MKLTGPTDKARGLLRTYLWLVVLATCVAIGAAFAAAAAAPLTYTATAEVVVSPTQTDSNPLAPDMGTERAIAQSGVVVRDAASILGIDQATVREGLSVTVVPQSWVLHISYQADTAETAYRGASALATSYVDYRNHRGATSSATLVTAPSVPAAGSRGSLPIFLALGLVAGLAVGVAAAWLWDRVSDRVRSGPELRDLSGLPVLTHLRRWDSKRSPLPPDGPARESFAFVAARLSSMSGRDGGRTIVVTSPRSGAGTTSLACGTAIALAAQGKRVLLIGASSAGVRPEQVLGVPPPGSSRLRSRGTPHEMAQQPTGVKNLSLAYADGAAGAGIELEDLRLALDRLDTRAFVVVDAPPVLTSADALLLSDIADFVVLVGDLRSGTRADVRETLALLHDVRPSLAGWVTNLPRRGRGRQRLLRSGAGSGPPELPASVPKESDGEAVPLRPPAGGEPDRIGHDHGRAAAVTKKSPRWPSKKPPDVPRTATPPRDGVRPVRAPYAAARRR